MSGSRAGLPWHGPGEPRSRFPVGDGGLASFLARPAWRVARDLLGARIRVTSLTDGPGREGSRTASAVVETESVIVETEAYLGPIDPASHAATRRGITPRNRLMFGPAGYLYVYRSYGVHWCLNVVTGADGEGEAVLIRGVEILRGEPVASTRRGGRSPIAAGPGRVAEALGVSGDANGHDLGAEPIRILPGWSVPDDRIRATGRVGVSKAAEWPLRFLVLDSPGVSRGPCHPGDAALLPEELRPVATYLSQSQLSSSSTSNA